MRDSRSKRVKNPAFAGKVFLTVKKIGAVGDDEGGLPLFMIDSPVIQAYHQIVWCVGLLRGNIVAGTALILMLSRKPQ